MTARTILAAALLLAPACGDDMDPIPGLYVPCEQAQDCEQPAQGCAYPLPGEPGYCTMFCRQDSDCPPTEDGEPVACRPADGGGSICTIPQ